MAAIAPQVNPAMRRAEEDAAWSEVQATLSASRLRWNRIIERVHIQRCGPLLKCILTGERLSGPWWTLSAVKKDPTWRVANADGGLAHEKS